MKTPIFSFLLLSSLAVSVKPLNAEPSPLPSTPPPSEIPPPEGPLTELISKDLFEKMLLHRNATKCSTAEFYTYEAFIAAANAYPAFGNVGNDTTRKREIAAFFGQTSHETSGGSPDAPDGPYAWGYCFKAELESPSGSDYCQPNYPCVPGKSYYGRGPMLLSGNDNYAKAGEALGLDLLSYPELVENDSLISFKTAIWFWMTPQSPKPSCHEVMAGIWEPSSDDNAMGWVPGYGLTTNIIDGFLECGGPIIDDRVEDRIGYYKRYCDLYGIDYGDNLDCYVQAPFHWGVSLSSM